MSYVRKSQLRGVSLAYHRNGVFGEGFHLCRFYYGEAKKHLLATVFEAPGRVAVINPDDVESRWRGDVFEPALREIIAEAEKLRA